MTMTRDPITSLALERAALISADIEEQLTARSKDGMRPLIAVLAKARHEAADAIAALVDTPPSDAAAIARLQNEVRRFADLVRFLREIVNDGLDQRYEVADAERDELERLIAPEDDRLDAEAAREREALGI
ncbi:MAG TPA: hypothetical protein VGX95_11250 [Xanthobacteraceae bacterium]|jgi:hypothetical protein|nr:hypothetical protein [Xanthobacteraceae bacterium]